MKEDKTFSPRPERSIHSGYPTAHSGGIHSLLSDLGAGLVQPTWLVVRGVDIMVRELVWEARLSTASVAMHFQPPAICTAIYRISKCRACGIEMRQRASLPHESAPRGCTPQTTEGCGDSCSLMSDPETRRRRLLSTSARLRIDRHAIPLLSSFFIAV